MKRYLVTGGCGFIGTSLISNLITLDRNIQIIVFDNLSTGTPSDLSNFAKLKVVEGSNFCEFKSGVYLVIGDVRNLDSLKRLSKDVDCIIHLAANTGVGQSVSDPRIDMECNIIGTFNALEAARTNNVKKFVFASSGAPIGNARPPIHEELSPHPVSPYGASKLAGEGYCSAYFHSFGINTICLRFGNVFGPGSKHKNSIVAKFIRQALRNEICEVYGDGSQTRDYIYIDDLVDALNKAIETPVGGEIFQIASSIERTVSEVSHIIQERLEEVGVKMKIRYRPYRKGDVARNFSDVSKARLMLDWKSCTNFEFGIDKTIEYFLSDLGKS